MGIRHLSGRARRAAPAAFAAALATSLDPTPTCAAAGPPAAVVLAQAQDDAAPDAGLNLTYGQRDDVARFGAELAARRGLDADWVAAALRASRFQPAVARLIMPPPAGTAKNWNAYRGRFVEPMRIRAGVAFWRANRRWLAIAEQRYGVPPEIVIGVLGVESIYAQQMGGFRVLDALATLSFDFPAGRKDRSAFFRDELEAFLVMCRREGLDPTQPRGSYAGAIGMPQFMPSSFIRYAVDFDGDGHVDLWRNGADAIGSVANYLSAFGWARGMPTRFQIQAPVETRERAILLAPDIVPTFTAQELIAHGAALSDAGLLYSARFETRGPSGAAAELPRIDARREPATPAATALVSAPAASAASAVSTSAAAAGTDTAAGPVGALPAESAEAAASAALPSASDPASSPGAIAAPTADATPAAASAAMAQTVTPASASAASAPAALKFALVELQNGDAAPSYVAGTPNFYVITRYNWSSYYAMAVIELGEAVARELARTPVR